MFDKMTISMVCWLMVFRRNIFHIQPPGDARIWKSFDNFCASCDRSSSILSYNEKRCRRCGLPGQEKRLPQGRFNVRTISADLHPLVFYLFSEQLKPWISVTQTKSVSQVKLRSNDSRISIVSCYIFVLISHRMKLFYGLVIHSKSIDDLCFLPNTVLIVDKGKVNT